jgi:hypothetical protein
MVMCSAPTYQWETTAIVVAIVVARSASVLRRSPAAVGAILSGAMIHTGVILSDTNTYKDMDMEKKCWEKPWRTVKSHAAHPTHGDAIHKRSVKVYMAPGMTKDV